MSTDGDLAMRIWGSYCALRRDPEIASSIRPRNRLPGIRCRLNSCQEGRAVTSGAKAIENIDAARYAC